MSTELLVVGGERRPAAEDKSFTVIEPGTGLAGSEQSGGVGVPTGRHSVAAMRLPVAEIL